MTGVWWCIVPRQSDGSYRGDIKLTGKTLLDGRNWPVFAIKVDGAEPDRIAGGHGTRAFSATVTVSGPVVSGTTCIIATSAREISVRITGWAVKTYGTFAVRFESGGISE